MLMRPTLLPVGPAIDIAIRHESEAGQRSEQGLPFWREPTEVVDQFQKIYGGQQ